MDAKLRRCAPFINDVTECACISIFPAKPPWPTGDGAASSSSSESALNIPADMIHYGFTKTAQLSIARGLAKRVAGTGVTVNSVLPGPTLSEGVAKILKDTMATGRSLEDAGGLRQGKPSVVDHPACGERRGSCQHDRLCLLAAGLRDHGRGAACRRRRRRHHRLRVRHERGWRSLTRRSDAPDSARL
jgi:hypothetical protein